MEIEAKQQALRTSTRSIKGPCVQYRSTTMPLSQVRFENVYKIYLLRTMPNSDCDLILVWLICRKNDGTTGQ